MRLLLDILVPWFRSSRWGDLFAGVVRLILQLSLIGWVPAAIWSVYALSQYKTDQKIKVAVGRWRPLVYSMSPVHIRLDAASIEPRWAARDTQVAGPQPRPACARAYQVACGTRGVEAGRLSRQRRSRAAGTPGPGAAVEAHLDRERVPITSRSCSLAGEPERRAPPTSPAASFRQT